VHALRAARGILERSPRPGAHYPVARPDPPQTHSLVVGHIELASHEGQVYAAQPGYDKPLKHTGSVSDLAVAQAQPDTTVMVAASSTGALSRLRLRSSPFAAEDELPFTLEPGAPGGRRGRGCCERRPLLQRCRPATTPLASNAPPCKGAAALAAAGWGRGMAPPLPRLPLVSRPTWRLGGRSQQPSPSLPRPGPPTPTPAAEDHSDSALLPWLALHNGPVASLDFQPNSQNLLTVRGAWQAPAASMAHAACSPAGRASLGGGCPSRLGCRCPGAKPPAPAAQQQPHRRAIQPAHLTSPHLS
jgi:hypothetical protein